MTFGFNYKTMDVNLRKITKMLKSVIIRMLKGDFIQALLAIADGTVLEGTGFGCKAMVTGEVVFNTGMVGYTETLTDPSYRGQILLQTYPLIGNYGVPPHQLTDEHGLPLHFESEKVQVAGYAVAELQTQPSHWSNSRTLGSWLAQEGIPGIDGIDTRALTRRLSTKGSLRGALIVGEDIGQEEAVRLARRASDPNAKDLVSEVTVSEPVSYNNSGSVRVVVIDCGMKNGILRELLSRGANVIRVPSDSSLEEIQGFNPAGVLISNGPGDPKKCAKTINTVRSLIEGGLPLMGICLGNQIMALAAGADTYKMIFGHRGQYQPCIDLRTKKCYITSQNHGFAVMAETLEGTGFEVSYRNANDGTVEGIRHETKPVFGVQFHPEASPGPDETGFLFEEFLMEARK
jgi:carbamoyl-phosphate synthase small subunit